MSFRTIVSIHCTFQYLIQCRTQMRFPGNNSMGAPGDLFEYMPVLHLRISKSLFIFDGSKVLGWCLEAFAIFRGAVVKTPRPPQRMHFELLAYDYDILKL
ncbi:hypothetical protein CEXT_783101 [Caerostris extrusa]|uniref:Uncharacterized protein n=1 Tax=Caerostris extrusa TaxID=172846 RepID=A0AAV4TX43_CAEEX|nr:hypothetical protein CEXT_783101 [Caerostris extrusa]